MLKRFLAVVLAGCLTFDAAPMTAFATGTQTSVVVEDSTEEVSESAESEEDVEPADISEDTAEEESGESSEEVSTVEESSEEENVPEESIPEESFPMETGTEEDISMAEESVPEPDAEITVEIPEEGSTELESYNDFLELAEVTQDDVIPLQYGETNSITAPYDSNAKWYSFTAPEDGYYDFYTGKAQSDTVSYPYAYLALYDAVDGMQITYQEVSSWTSAVMPADKFMKAGDTLYLRAYHYSSSYGDVVFSLDIQKRTTFLTEMEDGSYSYETEDYTLLIKPEAGYYSLRLNISMGVPEGKTLGSYTLSYKALSDSSTSESSTSFSASSPDRTINISANPGTEYRICLVLKDSAGNSVVLSMENGNLVMNTKLTEQPVVIYDENTRSEMNRIVFDVESSKSIYCYYAPTDGSEAEKQQPYYRTGRFECSFSQLEPDTEYYFQFTDENRNLLVERRVATSAGTAQAEYRVGASFDSYRQMQLSLEANVSGYEGNAGYAYLYYEYTDALGEKHSGNQRQNLNSDADFTIKGTVSNVALEADKQYDITVWIKRGDLTFKKQVKTITTPAAAFEPENLVFTVKADPEKDTEASYTVQLPEEIEGISRGTLFYRQCGDQGAYTSKTIALSSSSASGTVTSLQSGGEYEFILFLGGVRKEQIVTLKSGGLKLTQTGDGETNAFDLVRTYMVNSENSEELAEEYYLRLAYWSGSSYYSLGDPVVLNAENQYQAEIKTAAAEILEPDTDYHLRWTVSESMYGSAVCTLYETVHTKKAEVVLESVKSIYNEQQYKVSLKEEDTVNFSDASGNALYLYAYMRKADTTGYRATGIDVSLSGKNDFSNTIRFSGLTEETSYDISLRSDTGKEYAAVSFTTPKDTRTLRVTGEEPGMNNVIITYAMGGVSEGMSGYVLIYIREKGEKDWNRADYDYFSGPGTDDPSFNVLRYKNAELKAATVYEYQIGFGTNYNTQVSELEKVVTGEFCTREDTRALRVTTTEPGIHAATIKYVMDGIYKGMSGYACLYVREKGAESWELSDRNYFSGPSTYEHSFSVSRYNGAELKENTVYEYQMGFGEYNTPLSKLEKTTVGEFTTREDTRSLSNIGVSASYTKASVSALFSGGDIPGVSSYIYCFYKEKEDSGWIQSGSYVYGSGYASRNCSWNLNSLKNGTVYDYAIVISEQWNCYDPDTVEEGSRKISGEFKTKECEYTLSFAVDESKTASNRAVVSVTADGSTEDSRIEVSLTLSDGQQKQVTLKQAEDYKKDVVFTGLLGGREYTIVSAAIRVKEGGSLTTIGELPCDYKFTTPEAQAPDDIILSEEEITLNAAGIQNYLDGYNCITLKADVMPKTAAADFVWSSSDETVAVVSPDGTVYAEGVGTAQITVTSAYDEAVSASCEVTVKNYVIGYSDEAGEVQPLNSFSYNWKLYKGSSVKGIGYYEQNADGSLELLQDYVVKTEKRNIVSWRAGSLLAENSGSTRVIFEKDGCRAAFIATVSAAGRGFGITGFQNNAYPAVETDNGYILAFVDGINYRAMGKISPEQNFSAYDFNWSISDPEIAEVSDAGVITPLKAGIVTLTVTPKMFLADEPYIQEKVEIELDIRELPATADDPSIYALANVSKKLSDVNFPEGWESGWKWKYPDTPLVINGVNRDAYAFEAVYEGESYPIQKTINIYIGKITAVSVSEMFDAHNQVLEVGENDSITLAVGPFYQGRITEDEYTVEIPAPQGLTVTENKVNGTWIVTAQKKGNYTLNPVVKSGDTVLAKASYKIKAVEEKQVGSITFTTDTEGVTINGNTVIFDSAADRKDFTLQAVVQDRYGEEIQTALQWKTTDKTVAVATPESKSNTHTAKVSVKAEGHAVIMVNAKDAAGLRAELNVEIRDHKPRIDKDKAVVNIAYDYTDSNGKSLASAAGAVEIVPVYGEAISSVGLYDQSGDTVVTNLKISRYDGYQYLIEPAKTEIPTGVYDCILRVETNQGTVYKYSLKVTVVDNSPSVSAKMGSQANLFFTYSTGQIDLAISGGNRVKSVTWEDASEGANNGFAMTSRYYLSGKTVKNYITVSQQDIKIRQGILDDPLITKGKLTVKVAGYRKEYTFEDFEVKYQYKKPTIVTRSASSSIAPSVGLSSGSFSLYDNTNKRYLYYRDTAVSYCFDEIESDNEDMEFRTSNNSSTINYFYSGTEGTKKLTLTVDSEYWREPLTVSHTIKAVAPKAYLSTSRLTYNAAVKSTSSVYVYLQNMKAISYTDIVIEGANAKSQKLLDDNLLVMTAQGNIIEVEQSQADLMKTSIPKGSYSYKITPYYGDTALNTLKLTVKVVDKPVTAKISPKGSLDLANGTSYSLGARKNVVVVDPKFSNLSDGYTVTDYKLVGEYSEYFSIHYDYQYSSPYGYHYYITSKSTGKLKAGQTYKLAVEYTLTSNEGEQLTVTSNTFKVKPKQSKPKVTIIGNNQTLYAAADMSRSYSLSVPAYYSIQSASGSLDCNKDGNADIVVSGGSTLTVSISDKDAVGASAKGKVYSIPVTVRLVGRDGVSTDVKITVKVKVKR